MFRIPLRYLFLTGEIAIMFHIVEPGHAKDEDSAWRQCSDQLNVMFYVLEAGRQENIELV